MSMQAFGLVAALLAAETSSSPVEVSNPFVIPWHHDSVLACLTFTNTSDRTITAVRFGVTTTQQNPLGSDPESAFVDRLGSFAPGVAIKPPTKFLGTVNSNSAALANCWESTASNIKSEVHITVLKVVYADGSVWTNPTPEPLASLTY